MQNKFEQLLDYLVNEETDKANELFHQIVVEKSREIYESLIDETDLAEVGGNDVESMVDEITMDEEGMSEGDGEEEFDISADDDGDEEVVDFEADEEGSEGVEDKIEDIKDKLDELMAEFEEIMGDDEAEEAAESEELLAARAKLAAAKTKGAKTYWTKKIAALQAA